MADNDTLTLAQGRMIAQASKQYSDTKTVTCETATPDSGYASAYVIKQNNVQVGAKINIPKDYLVRSADVKICTEPDVPVEGYEVGQQYIDFVVNTADDGGTPQHIYLLVSDLVAAYKQGNGISISLDNTISVRVAVTGGNGLSATEDGLKLALATPNVTTVTYVQATGTYVEGETYYTDSTGTTIVDTTGFEPGVTDVSMYYVEQSTTTPGTAGALSAADKTKLDNLSEDASIVTVPGLPNGTINIDGTPNTVVQFAADGDIYDMLDDVFSPPEPEPEPEPEP